MYGVTIIPAIRMEFGDAACLLTCKMNTINKADSLVMKLKYNSVNNNKIEIALLIMFSLIK
jgi:hypothetical protein